MPETEDTELLKQYARSQSETAFAALVQRYVNLVYSVALRKTGSPHAAKEITQAVFIVLAKKAASLSGKTVLSGWLYQTARLTAANYLRTEIRRAKREQEAYMQSLSNEPEPDVWPQIAPLLEDAMGRLGEKDRNVIVLRFLEGKSLNEVGVALGASEDAAKVRVARALEKLRSYFSKRGVTLTGAIIAGTVSANSVQAAPVGLITTIAGTAVKGSAISASTITLAKGALKLMAWTKAKTAVVAGAVLILATGTATVAVKAVHSARVARYPNIQGAWEGIIEVAQTKLRVVFNVAKTNSIYAATLDSVDQGTKDVPVGKVIYDYPSVRFEANTIGGVFDGSLNSQTNELSGTWKQGKVSVPVVLKRTDQPATIAAALSEKDYSPRPDSDVQGFWKGTLVLNGVPLRLNFKISEQPAGTFRVRLDSVDQGGNNIAASSATYQRSALKVEFAGINGLFEGNVDGGKTEIAGTWKQLGKQWPLTLKRGDIIDEAHQQSQISYYHSSEGEVQGHWKGALDARGVKLRMIFNIGKMADGTFSASLVSVDQGNMSFPATSINWSQPNLQMEWKAIGGVFEGKLQNGKLAGTWRQGNASLPLTMDRSSTE